MVDMVSSSRQAYGDPETRRRILDAALEAAGELGPSMRLADVANRAGVSHQGLYLHFQGRDALLVALLTHMVETFDVHARYRLVQEAPDGVTAIRALVDHLGFMNSKLDTIGWVLEEAQHLDQAFGQDWQRRVVGLREAIESDVIGRLVSEGSLRTPWSVTDAADLFLSVTTLGTWRDLTLGLGWTPEEYTNNITRILEAGLMNE